MELDPESLAAAVPGLLAQPDLIAALLILGAGTTVFLIAEQALNQFSALNAIFVIAGLLAGAALTAAGGYMTYQALLPVLQG